VSAGAHRDAAAIVMKNIGRRPSHDNAIPWLWVPAQGRDDVVRGTFLLSRRALPPESCLKLMP
jgi:hypothetical protein